MTFREPTYQDVILEKHSGNDSFDISEDFFNELWDNIYVEEVLVVTINDKIYQAYSQAVPNGTTSRADIKYCLVFLVEESQSYASVEIETT